ncbi:MAG: hypothetical protein U5R48_13330 [Gammaproteobacteria bacterium]|nr:hypothetical protein [Gammaproteobacteria bacterium]
MAERTQRLDDAGYPGLRRRLEATLGQRRAGPGRRVATATGGGRGRPATTGAGPATAGGC